jgi:hypothetical protein
MIKITVFCGVMPYMLVQAKWDKFATVFMKVSMNWGGGGDAYGILVGKPEEVSKLLPLKKIQVYYNT